MNYEIKDETISFGDSIGLKNGSCTNARPKSDDDGITGVEVVLYNKTNERSEP